ncbi:MAG: AAA family ATPase [Anaerolineae bacterium]|nr:AAA family ATPase [Anaerolineae bacterium]
MATDIFLTKQTVLSALNAMQTGNALGDHPLCHFHSIQTHLGTQQLLTGDDAVYHAVYHHLTQTITTHLTRLRQIAELPIPDVECSNFTPAGDYQHNNEELEAWSVLYHRYVCINHNLSNVNFADLVSVEDRTIRRRLNVGITRLMHILVDDEQLFRQQRKREHLLLSLPTRHPPRLFSNESVFVTSHHLLAEADSPRHVVLFGPSGVGKSTLAQNLAYDLVTNEYFDDFLWLEPNDPAYLLPEIIARLGLSSNNDTLVSLNVLRAYLSEHSALFVFDNAESLLNNRHCANVLAPLENASILLISQHAPPPDLRCYTLALPELTREQAVAFLHHLTHRLAEQDVPHWIERMDDIWQAVGGNLQALKWVLYTAYSLPLDVAITGHESPDALLMRVWNQLTPVERRIILLPVLYGNAGIVYEHILLLSDLAAADANHAIESLVNQALLLPHHEADTVWYTLQSANFTSLLNQIGQGLFIAAHHPALDFIRQAIARFIAYVALETKFAPQAISVLRLAHKLDLDPDEQWHYAYKLAVPITAEALWPTWSNQLQLLLDLSLPPHRVAWVHFSLGVALRWLGELDNARTHFDQAYAYYVDHGDPIAHAGVLIELAVIHRYQLNWDQAYHLAQSALHSYQRIEHSDGIVRSLHELAQLTLEAQDPYQTLRWLNTLPTTWTPRTWGIASQAHLLLAQHERALAAANHAFAELPLSHPNAGRVANTIGQIYYESGNTAAAINSLVSATLLLGEGKDLLGYARASNNLAVAYIDEIEHMARERNPENDDDPDEQVEHLRRARQIHNLLHRARGIQEEVGDAMGLLVTEQNLAWFTQHFPDL